MSEKENIEHNSPLGDGKHLPEKANNEILQQESVAETVHRVEPVVAQPPITNIESQTPETMEVHHHGHVHGKRSGKNISSSS
jgi:hypothetical protein